MTCLATVFSLAILITVINGYPFDIRDFTEDSSTNYHKIGCYKDYHNEVRPLPKLMFTDRDPSSPLSSGKSIEWDNWEAYVTDLASRCAKAVKDKGYMFFGLQYYGECWSSSVPFSFTFNIDGIADNCVDGMQQKCSSSKSKICVGADNSLYVYNV